MTHKTDSLHPKVHLKSNLKAKKAHGISSGAKTLLESALVVEKVDPISDFTRRDFYLLSEKQPISDELFELIDLNLDGKLDQKELSLLLPLSDDNLEMVQTKLSDHDTSGIIQNKDGLLDKNEFKTFVNDETINPLVVDTLNSLTNQPQPGDGKLTQPELIEIFEPKNILEVIFNKVKNEKGELLRLRGDNPTGLNSFNKFAEHPTIIIYFFNTMDADGNHQLSKEDFTENKKLKFEATEFLGAQRQAIDKEGKVVETPTESMDIKTFQAYVHKDGIFATILNQILGQTKEMDKKEKEKIKTINSISLDQFKTQFDLK